MQGVSDLFKFVTDVELVGIEQQEDQVTSRGKSFADADEVILSFDALLLSVQNTGSVDSCVQTGLNGGTDLSSSFHAFPLRLQSFLFRH